MSQEPKKRVLAGRYELEAVLGQGGMARVFRGTDRVLNRTVAVKVLSPQFADDDQFVARFRREAQAAAGLNHPNIVSVYDTGSQGEVHFIVMEYVEGRTLRDVIRQEGPLLPERGAEITESVARGLAAAHESGLVHRDVKPGNIMITREGEVKVMDFGIARTSSGDTLTQTAAILGTASYLSPEQAQGESVDLRSDIYSVGCVLYEMLTGRPPFTGDSPVSIAYKHVRENPALPSRMNPDIPQGLEAVVMKCMAKNPENRYRTADELREDLARVLQGLPTVATPILEDATAVLTQAPGPDATAVMTGGPPEEPERGRRVWPIVLVVLLVLAAIGAAAFWLISSLEPEQDLVPVPNVVGDDEEEATERLERAGFEVVAEEEFNPDVRRGEVYEQDPAGGDEAERGDTVTIVVSKGERPVEVPGVVGESLPEAEAILTGAGLSVGSVTREDSQEPEGTVLSQSPSEGERAQEGTDVDLVVSGGPGTVTVPNVFCKDVDEARATMNNVGLSLDVVGSEFSSQCPEGTVIEQNPEAGAEVEDGSTVTVIQSKGPEPTPSVTIPSPTLDED
ncbi:MAG: Stk1 family PASTA domain-containing Ser/Thr kinase [Actinomycetota bacterium]|nr:Stk1 family PASTA domain-containing Ser/Thr kinase [Actinomycetota bacterium]